MKRDYMMALKPQENFSHLDPNFFPLSLLILFLSVLFVFPQQPAAETGSEDQIEKLSEKIRELTGEMESTSAELRRLDSSLPNIREGDQPAVERQILSRQLKLLRGLGEIGGTLAELEETGGELADIRIQLEEIVELATPRVKNLVEEKQEQLSQLNQKLVGQDARGFSDTEKEIRRITRTLDSLIRNFMRILNLREQLDLEVDSSKDFLRTFLWYRAEVVSGRIQQVEDQLSDLEDQLKQLPEDTDLKNQLRIAQDRMELLIETLSTSVDALDVLEVNTVEYKKILVGSSGRISTAVLDTEVAKGLIHDWWSLAEEWINDSLPGIIVRSIVFLLILIFSWIISRVVRKIVKISAASSRLNLSTLLQSMAVSMVSKGILIIGFLIALSHIGVEIGPMLAGIGILGFIVGFALQDSLSNFAAGVMILVYKPFDVGDFVEVSGAMGKVHGMSFVSTTILTVDNQTLVVPNSKIWGDIIRNLTAEDIRRVDLVFGISYSDDIPKAETILDSILKDHDDILEDPASVVKLYNLGDSSVDFVVRPWCKTEKYWDVYWDVTREVKMRFDREGISIPFPQRDVHIYSQQADSETTSK
jgi:small conductance mechanosensitive channel